MTSPPLAADVTMTMPDPHNLARFLTAKEGVYAHALAEIRAGRHRTRWMWFVFPQIQGLGSSWTTRSFAIKNRDEAAAYLAHPVLGPRLREICEALLDVDGKTASEIFGSPDDLKLRYCATLFAGVSERGSVFDRVLERFFGGKPDPRTLRLLRKGGMRELGGRPDGEALTGVEYRIPIDQRYLVGMLRGHRQPEPVDRFFFALKTVLASILAFASISSAFHGWPGMTVLWAFLIAILFLNEGRDWWALRRSLRRLTAFGRVLRLMITPEGVCLVGNRKGMHPWSDFTDADIYPDGIKLHLTGTGVYWLPDSALVVGTRRRVESLLGAKIPAQVGPDEFRLVSTQRRHR